MSLAILILLLATPLGASSINATLAAFTPTDGSYVPWAATRFHVILPYDNNDASLDPRPYNVNVIWRGYIDLAFAYPADMYVLKASATAHGFTFEDALLHAKANYVAGIAWSGTDQFDVFESTTSKGVFLLSGGVYTDKTTAAYDVTTADVAITDQLLIGYAEPFAEINFILSTGQSGETVTWAYWNGSSYATLTLASDTTTNLTSSGKIIFTPPAAWAAHVENGSKSKYWVRATVTGGSIKPTASRIYGADWMSSTNALGWDATSGSRVNIGLGNLEYNPTPPAGALAKFRYQSRATGTWAANATFGNFAAKVGSEYSWAWYLVDVLQANTTGKTATTCDDFGTVPPNLPQANLDIPSSPDEPTQITSMAQWMVTKLQAVTPGYEVDFNLASASYDSNIKSITATPPVSANHENSFHSFVNAPPTDKFTSWNSGNNAVAQFVCVDSIHTPFDWHFGKWTYWSTADRGPMNCLSMYWLSRQANINFTYNPNGYTYNESDEYYYWSSSTTTLVGSITAPSTTLTADLVPAGDWTPTAISVASTSGYPTDGSHFWLQIGTGSTSRLFDAYITGGVLTTTQAEFGPTIPSGTTVRYLSNPSTRTIQVGSTSAMTAALPYSSLVTLRLGAPGTASGDIIHASIVDGSHVSTTDSIANDYSAGTTINWVQVGHQATDTLPAVDRIFKWGPWFPAMSTDLGIETVPLNATWKSGASVVSDPSICSSVNGQCGAVARHDYTGGSVFVRVGYGDDPRPTVANSPFDLATSTNPICIKDGDVYPSCTGASYRQLHADGTLGPLTKSFSLLGLEGKIFVLSVPTWTPEDLGGTLLQHYDGSSLGLTNGAAVTSLPDLSGNGHNATPANSGACTGGNPIYTTNAQNGLGVVTLSASNNQCFTSASPGDVRSVFYVGGLNTGSQIVLAGQDTGEAGNGAIGWFLDGYYDGSTKFCRGVTSEINGTCSALAAVAGNWGSPTTGQYTMVNANIQGNVATIYVNNTLTGTATSSATKRTLSNFALGAWYGTGHALVNPLGGNIGEWIATSELTEGQRAQLVSYLSRKWFVTTPSTYEFSAFDSATIFRLLTSSDGTTWVNSPASYFELTGGAYRTAGIRDPSTVLLNGTWWMVSTYSFTSTPFASSADRGLWTTLAPIPNGGVAPEWFIDTDQSVHVLGWVDDTVSGCASGHYCITEIHPANNDPSSGSWSSPAIFTIDVAQVIDPYMLHIGATYYLFGKDQAQTKTALWTSAAMTGPYTFIKYLAPGNEGPSVIRVNNKWRLYTDPGSGGIQYADCDGDPATCTWTATLPTNMPFAASHGTANVNPPPPQFFISTSVTQGSVMIQGGSRRQ